MMFLRQEVGRGWRGRCWRGSVLLGVLCVLLHQSEDLDGIFTLEGVDTLISKTFTEQMDH